jgi:tetratricopeptide (TPR) repeat protein
MYQRLARDLFISVSLVALVLVAYYGAWNKEFVYFDDPGYVTDNLNVQKGLTAESIYWSFTAFEQSNWHPLTWISHQTDIQFYGLKNPGGHHVTNLILHSFNVLLAFWLFRLLTGRAWCSALVAALFAVHPMHVESVIWVAERKDVLSTFLGLVTFIFYFYYAKYADFKIDTWAVVLGMTGVIGFLAVTWLLMFHYYTPPPTVPPTPADKYAGIWIALLLFSISASGTLAAAYSIIARRPHVLLYYAIVVLFTLGLLAKPMLVTLPCVCLLLDFWPLNRLFSLNARAVEGIGVSNGTGNGNGEQFEDDYRSSREIAAAARRSAGGERSGPPRRKLRRNQKLPGSQMAAERRPAPAFPSISELPKSAIYVLQALLLLIEKTPLFILSYISCKLTPYAQNHGGSMATADELPFDFRIQNAVQAYFLYLKKMVSPGQMTSLYLLDRSSTVTGETKSIGSWVSAWLWKTLLVGWPLIFLAALVIGVVYLGHRYLSSRWHWYLDILIPMVSIIGSLVVLDYRLDREANAVQPTIALLAFVMITSFAIWTLFTGRRYIAFGWFWYVGILVPVIGLVQVGEQAIADRYTYVPYIGIFLMLIFALGELVDSLKGVIHDLVAAGFGILASLLIMVCVGGSWKQEDYWRNAEAHLDHALSIYPTNWNMLNNKGVKLWEHSVEADAEARKAAAEGRDADVAAFFAKSEDFKKRAVNTWEKGILNRPTATDIHSNLGYAYSEKAQKEAAAGHVAEAEKYLDLAERHLEIAVNLKPISPRPRNNLGRVYLVKSQNAKAKGQIELAARYVAAAIDQFQKSIELDPTLLEAHANLAQVYFDQKRYNESSAEYDAILSYITANSAPEKRQTFAAAFLGLYRIDLARNDLPSAEKHLIQAAQMNPGFIAAHQELARLYVQAGKAVPAEHEIWAIASQIGARDRIEIAKQIAVGYIGPDQAKPAHPKEAAIVLSSMSWILATCPVDAVRNAQAALAFSDNAWHLTGGQDPRSLDSYAAALAENGRFPEAVQYAAAAADLAEKQGNARLAAAIRGRVDQYRAQKPYRCKLDDSDRP